MVTKQVDKGVGPALAAVLPHDGLRWYQKGHLLKLNFCIISAALFSSANGYDGSMMNGLQALPQWQEFMGHPTGSWLGFISAVQSLGACIGYPLAAWLSNKIGRKPVLMASYLWLLLGVGLQTGARNQAMFVMGRLFLGGVTSFSGTAGLLIVNEAAYPTHRAILSALYLSGWYVGSTIAAWATYGTRNYSGDTADWAWRIPSLLQIAIPLVILPGCIMLCESPRYLIAAGKDDEAKALLTKIHGGGDSNSPLVAYEMAEIQAAIEHETMHRQTTSWYDLVRTKGNRHRTFISVTLGFYTQWNGVGVIAYYLAPVLLSLGITSVTHQTLISGFLNVWNLIIAVGAGLAVDRLGRRFLFLTAAGGMLVSYIIVTGLSGAFAHSKDKNIGIAVIPFLFIFYGFFDFGCTPLQASYPVEIWQYEMRARGIAVASISAFGANFFNIFVNPIALGSIEWKYYFVFIAVLVLAICIIYFAYPETNGHSLEEMAVIFDGEEASVVPPTMILANYEKHDLGVEFTEDTRIEH